MTDIAVPPHPLERLPSGVPGLDIVLRGGFLRGGIYLITGDPGTGKTILVNQIGFQHVAAGGRVVYVTLLAELHTRMLSHLQTLTFFDPAQLGDALYFMSGYHALEDGGLSGLLQLIQRAIRDHRASLVVLDGLATAQAVAESPLHFERFIQQLHAFIDLVGCTGLLVTARDGGRGHPEDTMVDGLLVLSDRDVGLWASRELDVRKFRGTGYLRGRHNFRITADGITVHPRTESLLASPQAVAAVNRVRLGFGVPQLDAMLDGGLFSSSTTMVLGPPGSGKTLLGLHFLAAGARAGEPGLHFGFYETPTRLIDKAAQVGLAVSSFAADGLLEILWQSPLEDVLDALAERLLEAVKRRQVRRLVIDGLNGFQAAAVYPERLSRFCTALTHELRRLDVTTLIAVETRHLESEELEVPITDLSAVVENILFLRYWEDAVRRSRVLSILKLRESGYDPTLRAFTITEQGIAIAAAATPVAANPPHTPDVPPLGARREAP
jgi:circadian clock protein KaiC